MDRRVEEGGGPILKLGRQGVFGREQGRAKKRNLSMKSGTATQGCLQRREVHIRFYHLHVQAILGGSLVIFATPSLVYFSLVDQANGT